MGKTAIIITGPESSGSSFIGSVIAKAMKLSNNWSGRAYCNNLEPDPERKNDTIILHRSLPFFEDSYLTRTEYKTLFKNYDIKYVITMRDISIVNTSKMRRFKRSANTVKINYEKSKVILADIMRYERYFIWNYETMIYMGDIYFHELYKFLGTDSTHIPNSVENGNLKYLKSASKNKV